MKHSFTLTLYLSCPLIPTVLFAPSLLIQPLRLSYMLRLFPEQSFHLPPELRMRSPQTTLLSLRSSQVEAVHSAKVQKLRSAFSSLLLTTSKPLRLHPHIKMCLLCFSRHLAISLKLTDYISFDTAISFHAKILCEVKDYM